MPRRRLLHRKRLQPGLSRFFFIWNSFSPNLSRSRDHCPGTCPSRPWHLLIATRSGPIAPDDVPIAPRPVPVSRGLWRMPNIRANCPMTCPGCPMTWADCSGTRPGHPQTRPNCPRAGPVVPRRGTVVPDHVRVVLARRRASGHARVVSHVLFRLSHDLSQLPLSPSRLSLADGQCIEDVPSATSTAVKSSGQPASCGLCIRSCGLFRPPWTTSESSGSFATSFASPIQPRVLQ